MPKEFEMALSLRSTEVARPKIGTAARPGHRRPRSILLIGARAAAVLATIVLVLLGTIIVFLTQPYWPMLVGLLVLAGAVALGFWGARRYAIRLTAVIVIGGI